MLPGLNQDVELLGRKFHIQTEVSGEARLTVRTAIFVGGKTVATRDSEIPSEIQARGDQSIRLAMRQQHNAVLVNLVERATRFSERKRGIEMQTPRISRTGEPGRKPVVDTRANEFAMELEAPNVDADESLREAIDVRRMIGELRHRLAIDQTTSEPRVRIAQAASVLSWVVSHPRFVDLRIDEQVRINLLKDLVEAWPDGSDGRLPAETADYLWSEITTFSNYLSEVNNRATLVRFDTALLRWALQEGRHKGMSSNVLRLLQLIHGRDENLDGMLDEPEHITTDTWLDRLRQVLADISPP